MAGDGTFLVVGNIGSKEGDIEKFEKSVPDLLRYSPTLMLVTGNLVPEGSASNYVKAYETLERISTRYGVAIEVTPGSSDRLNGVLPDMYKSYFGEPSASFTWGGVKFITVDSSAGVIEPKQIEFLEKHLTSPSFVFTHYPPAEGLWAFDALKSGTKELLATLGDRSNLVLGCFFGHIKTYHQEWLTTSGMILNFPTYVVGNAVEAFEISANGYSRPGKVGGLAVMVRNGKSTFDLIEATTVTA